MTSKVKPEARKAQSADSVLTRSDKDWILQTIETALQNQERALQEEINDRMAELDVSASSHRTKAIRFNDADKKQILAMIESAARLAATEYDDDTKKTVFNEYRYKNALPNGDEFENFIWVCEQKALDPRANQIYFQKRQGRAVYMVAIDSYRLMAERAGNYRPGKATEYFNVEHRPYYGPAPHHCITFCWKKDAEGGWYEISQIAFFEEYVQTVGRGDNRKPNQMWTKMGRSQLEKCSESKMLRKGWPSELGGIYTKEEMEQSENVARSGGDGGGNGKSSYREDLAAMSRGAENRGHGEEGFDQRPANEQRKKGPKEKPLNMEALCENCSDQSADGKGHMRKVHDGENGQGACMEEGCQCTGFSDTPVGPEYEHFTVNVNAGTDKKEKMVERMRITGKCIEFTAPNPGAKRQFCELVIYGLEHNRKSNPNDSFVCFHQHLFAALSLTPGEKVTLVVETKIDEGKTKAQNKGIVWQYIEDVLQIGRRIFADGKPAPEEEAEKPDTTTEAVQEQSVAVDVQASPQPENKSEVMGVPGVFGKETWEK